MGNLVVNEERKSCLKGGATEEELIKCSHVHTYKAWGNSEDPLDLMSRVGSVKVREGNVEGSGFTFAE